MNLVSSFFDQSLSLSIAEFRQYNFWGKIKNRLATWAANDEGNLMADVEEERQAMDDIHEHLLYNNHPISHWCYGHFHQSWHSAIGDILFKMLDIMEFYEIR